MRLSANDIRQSISTFGKTMSNLQQLQEIVSSEEEDDTENVEENENESDDESDEEVFEPIRFSPNLRAASANSNRYHSSSNYDEVDQSLPEVKIELMNNNSTNSAFGVSDSLVEIGGNVSVSFSKKEVNQSKLPLMSSQIQQKATSRKQKDTVTADKSDQNIFNDVSLLTRNDRPKTAIQPPKDEETRLSKIISNPVFIAPQVASSISGKISSKSKSKHSDSSTSNLEVILEQKMKENNLLRLRLQEQEKKIEEERIMLKKRLEQEKYKIEQEAIKNFIST
jgi:hypothetical protein